MLEITFAYWLTKLLNTTQSVPSFSAQTKYLVAATLSTLLTTLAS
ncbi:hypothetical protein MGSAQ_003395 [marine sediment metagenome]|uniref:Uncharacterized protein n=1 Tax=marine sediment metagenome TaxID=412755 RepID=A0A1B6NP10_9ZZZZ